MMTEFQSILKTADSFAAIESIQSSGTPLEIATRYQTRVNDLYWKAHDLPAVVIIGRAGIIFALSQRVDAESLAKLRSIAKAISYNIASFCWPGWDEPGIAPAAADVALGADCAKLNLRLAIELKKPPAALSKAHWMIGAYGLVIRDFELADSHFHFAEEAITASAAANPLPRRLNDGYLALSQLCRNQTDSELVAKLEQIIADLRCAPDDGNAFADQLITARRIFCNRGCSIDSPVNWPST